MSKSIKCLRRVISSGGILYTFYPLFRSGKYKGICHLAGGSGARYRTQLKGLLIRVTQNGGVYLKLEAKPKQTKKEAVII